MVRYAMRPVSATTRVHGSVSQPSARAARREARLVSVAAAVRPAQERAYAPLMARVASTSSISRRYRHSTRRHPPRERPRPQPPSPWQQRGAPTRRPPPSQPPPRAVSRPRPLAPAAQARHGRRRLSTGAGAGGFSAITGGGGTLFGPSSGGSFGVDCGVFLSYAGTEITGISGDVGRGGDTGAGFSASFVNMRVTAAPTRPSASEKSDASTIASSAFTSFISIFATQGRARGRRISARSGGSTGFFLVLDSFASLELRRAPRRGW